MAIRFGDSLGQVKGGAITATGTLSARSLQDRFADVVNVKDFGAVGNGVTDDTAAIQATIDANSGKAIYFPAGIYRLNNPIRIKKIYTALIADSLGSALLDVYFDSTSPAILVESDIGPLYPNIFGVHIENLYLTKKVGTTSTGPGIEFKLADAVRFVNSSIVGFACAVKINGGRNCFYSNLRLAAYNPITTTWPTGTSILELTKAPDPGTTTWAPSTAYTAGTSYVKFGNTTYVCTVSHTSTSSFDYSKWAALTGFTHMFDNCNIGGDFKADYAVSILSNDYCCFANCYISGAAVAIVRLDAAGDHLYDNWFDHCYFDGGLPYADNPSPLGVWIKENSEPNAVQHFTDCAFGQMDNAIFIDEESVTQVGVLNCRFRYCYESGISISSNDIDFRLIGGAFDNSCTQLSGKSLIQINDVNSAVIANNCFNFNAGSYPIQTQAIRLGTPSSIKTLTITGNTFTSNSPNVTDFNNIISNVDNLVIAGNSSNNSSNTVVGHVIGNIANSDPKSLDWYEEGTWTPTLLFGSSSTGITYQSGQRVGSYTRIGDRVLFDCYMLLTSKGSSTGTAKISGLPYDQTDLYPSIYSLEMGNSMPGLSGMLSTRREDFREFSIRCLNPSTGGLRALSATDFTNNTFLVISGNYKVV